MIDLNQDSKYVLWNLIEKYDKKYPAFCDILSRMIQNNFVHEDILEILDYCYTPDTLQKLDALELKGILDQYYDTIPLIHKPIPPNMGLIILFFCLFIGG